MRSYIVEIEVEGLSEEQLKTVMEGDRYQEEWCFVDDAPRSIVWHGSVSLYGAMNSQKEHKFLVQDFKAVNPACKIETRWLCDDDRGWDYVYRSEDSGTEEAEPSTI